MPSPGLAPKESYSDVAAIAVCVFENPPTERLTGADALTTFDTVPDFLRSLLILTNQD